MYTIIDERRAAEDPALRPVFEALAARAPGSRHAVVAMAPDADGGFAWVQALHHDVEGALRSFRYLAQKTRAAQDPADPRGQKVMESIERHIRAVEELKARLVDPLFPVDG